LSAGNSSASAGDRRRTVGEGLEIQIESLLRARFPRDLIEPVPKAEFGGDVLHRVLGPIGQACGTILWEVRQTKNWSRWLAGEAA
jgi:hypothetical protein